MKKFTNEYMKAQKNIAHPIWDEIYVESQEESQKENNMKEIEEIEEIEEVKTVGKYIPDNELAESKRIMRGRTMYTINSNMEIMKTETVRCNPSSYSYDAIKLFLNNNLSLLEDYFNDDDNRGIAFHECGYNGKAQDEFIQGWADEGVRVF